MRSLARNSATVTSCASKKNGETTTRRSREPSYSGSPLRSSKDHPSNRLHREHRFLRPLRHRCRRDVRPWATRTDVLAPELHGLVEGSLRVCEVFGTEGYRKLQIPLRRSGW